LDVQFEHTRLGVKIACTPSCHFLLFSVRALIDSLLATAVSQKLQSLNLQPVKHTSNTVVGVVAFCHVFLQPVNCRSCNHNHAEVVIVLVHRNFFIYICVAVCYCDNCILFIGCNYCITGVATLSNIKPFLVALAVLSS
jgi:hypothetical protein